ncbi:hypothetical protein [Treponema sp.]|jgi:hypothetical protein|uniref:hypothetical protein n=1 Tax=Treponema sp. TaxID=166 RepID=UPI00257D9653|nr:hypothetical protein [Treponema sp.]MBE6353954.1 hypothetical protein [Treponema sp.]
MKVSKAKPRYTSSKDTLMEYKEIAVLLKLSKKDAVIDRRLLNDSFQDMCSYLETDLEASYTGKNFPSDLKEALIVIFTNKHALYKSAADFTSGYDMDDVIEEKFEKGILDPDDFFDRFSTIPADAERILDRHKKFCMAKYTLMAAG